MEFKTKHHYISQTYLRNFSPTNKQGLIYIINPETHREITLKSIRNIAYKNNYNSICLEGKLSDIPEQVFADSECRMGRIFKKLNNKVIDLIPEEWADILYYAAQTFLNIPPNRLKSKEDLEDFTHRLIELASTDKNLLSMLASDIGVRILCKKEYTRDELWELVQNKDNFKIVLSKRLLFRYVFLETKRLFEVLSKINWGFFIIMDDSYFVTTDNPVTPVKKSPNVPVSISTSDLMIFPLTKKILLAGKREFAFENVQIFGKETNAMNMLIMANAHNDIFSPLSGRELTEQIKKYG